MDPNNNNNNSNNESNHHRNAAGAADEDVETLQFSLTNPEELSSQLEEANLNDDETELLFQEAMKLNAQLKEALRRQQLDEPPTHQPHPPGRRVRSGKGRQYQSQSHPLAESFIQRNPRKACLPPIGSSGDKPKPRSDKARKPTGSVSPTRGSSGHKRKGSAKRTTLVDNRPAWDDRFSFS